MLCFMREGLWGHTGPRLLSFNLNTHISTMLASRQCDGWWGGPLGSHRARQGGHDGDKCAFISSPRGRARWHLRLQHQFLSHSLHPFSKCVFCQLGCACEKTNHFPSPQALSQMTRVNSWQCFVNWEITYNHFSERAILTILLHSS